MTISPSRQKQASSHLMPRGFSFGTVTNADMIIYDDLAQTAFLERRQDSVTRRIRADGTFAYSGQFRKNGNFQTFHQVPAHTVHIPERSIFRYTFHQNDYFRQEMAVRAKAVLNGTLTVEEAMTLVGSRVRRKLRASFTDGHLQPNADSTAKEKGGKDTPLIDTRDMYESLTFITDSGGSSK
ncbi:hypothetical protein [Pantoea agglomerans]|uniref:hypothetical protein n=1 Tax=Enterobacter agglomerans TaxID=549 RepID=UPI00137589C3|nr:hypothetical protein [Pantoea agglomerans]MBD8145139.1 hypothetical protein [Pantoea agglomerans]MBD8183721.1 hypothetical protein [Pantoea agglomerans]MBD8223446.1 hypothetical protein [Pantoea agglomerans]WVL80706.1 hypothetical protein IFT78_003055 [Pantoea agglomerans]